MPLTITVRHMLENLKHSRDTVVVVNGEAEDREKAIEFLEDDLARGVVRLDDEVEVEAVLSYTFRIMPPVIEPTREAAS